MVQSHDEHHLVIQRNEVLLNVTTQMNLENILNEGRCIQKPLIAYNLYETSSTDKFIAAESKVKHCQGYW